MTEPPVQLAAALAERFTIRRELGRGGMATVYLAHDRRHDRAVALKVLRPDLASAVGTERFMREIALTARLEHPGVLPLLDSGVAEGFLFYTMPFVNGETLRQRLQRERQLPVADAVRITQEVGDALRYAHGEGILHRDIKPENILLAANHARLADFGIARAIWIASGDDLTDTGIALGTLPYMSPEQASGSREVDSRSDIYSLACVLYEMLAGELPFTAPTAQVLLARKSLETPRGLRAVRPAIPVHVEAAAIKALSPLPADRHASVDAFVHHLAGVPLVDPGVSRKAWRFMRSRALLAVAAVILILVLGGVLLSRIVDPPTAPNVIPTRIAIFPFDVEDPQLEYLREGLMILIGGAIDGAGDIRRVDPYTLMARLDQERSAPAVDLRTASRIARELGAGRILVGRVVPSGRSIQIVASIYENSNLDEAEHRSEYHGPLDSVHVIADNISRDIVLRIPAGAGTWPTDGSRNATTSITALREYFRGERLIRNTRQDSAARAFRRALRSDSTFGLAWLRLAFAEEQRLNDKEMVAAIDQAVRLSDRLSTRDSMLAQTIRANYHGDGRGAERAALALTNAYPQWGEAWFQLASARFWYAWQAGRSPLVAEAALRKSLELDPDNRQSLHLSAWMAAYAGEAQRAESLQVRAWGYRWSVPADPALFSDFIGAASSWQMSRLMFLTYMTATDTDRLGHAAEIAKHLTDPDRHTEETRGLGYLLTARVYAAAGRWNAADEALRQADAVVPGMGLIEGAWYAALPFRNLTREARQAWLDSLRQWTPPRTYLDFPRARQPGRFAFTGMLVFPPWLVIHAQRYVIGLLSAHQGDYRDADRYARMLSTAQEPMDSIGLLRDFAYGIQALAAMRQGDTTRALHVLDSVSFHIASRYQAFESPFHTRPLARLLTAEALSALGRSDEALGWYSSHPWLDPGFVLKAWSCRRHAELHERLGQPDSAAHHYRRFTTRWRDSDLEHQELVTRLRHRADQLATAGAAN